MESTQFTLQLRETDVLDSGLQQAPTSTNAPQVLMLAILQDKFPGRHCKESVGGAIYHMRLSEGQAETHMHECMYVPYDTLLFGAPS